MTLKEKFKKATSQWFDVTECEKISNDYAIEVMEWYRRKCIISNFDMYMSAAAALKMYLKEQEVKDGNR
jgi:hypothetical protein